MSLRINSPAPNFQAETTHGRLDFYEWAGDRWAVLFSHPKDFTPVCATELSRMARIEPEFAARNTKVIGLSVDTLASHLEWVKDIESLLGRPLGYPIIADPHLEVAKLYDMLPEAAYGPAEQRTEADNATVRSVFVIGPEKRIRAFLAYPTSTGRNFSEVLRLLDSCQLADDYEVATPADWRHGEDVIILPEIADDIARTRFPDGWRAPLPYLRLIADPSFGERWFAALERH